VIPEAKIPEIFITKRTAKCTFVSCENSLVGPDGGELASKNYQRIWFDLAWRAYLVASCSV
jgi:hypothetical protein